MRTSINIEVDNDVKTRATQLFNDLGVNMNEAINTLLKNAIANKSISFNHKTHSVEDIKGDLDIIVKKLSKFKEIKKIILFGSYAYGEPRSTSDIDIAVIVDNKEYINKTALGVKYTLSIYKKINKSVDILVFGEEQFKETSNNKYLVQHDISKKGIVVYGQ